LAPRTKESRTATLFDPPHRLTACAALLSLAIKIGRGIAATFYRTMENVNNGLMHPPRLIVIETSQEVLA
jgi:hypothetical protein